MADEEVVTAPDNADVVETPEAAEEVAEVETTAEADAESETAEKEEAEEKPKPDPKIAKAKYEARELKRQNARLMKMLEQQNEVVSNVTRKEVKPPRIEDFETMDDYIEAQFEYRDSQKGSKETKATTEIPAIDDFSVSRDELSANGVEKYEDFEDVVFDESVRITSEMADAIFDIEDGELQVDVAYFLGNNPKEAARIARLSERRQIAEITKLEMKISSKSSAKAKPSKAPAPIKPVGGSKTSSSEIQPTEDYESFLKKRYKQLGR